MNINKFAIFSEGSIRGGVDTFLLNLIESWPETDSVDLLINSGYAGNHKFSNISRKNFNIFNWVSILKIFEKRHDSVPKISNIIKAIYRILYYPILFPLLIMQLYFFFKKNDWDYLLVVNGGHPGSLYCRAAIFSWALAKDKKSCIYSIHNTPSKFPWIIEIIEKYIDKWIFNLSKSIITVSNNAVSTFLSTSQRFSSWNLSFIYNGINDVSLSNSIVNPDNRMLLEINSLSPYVIMLATFEKRKGHDFLLEAFERVTKEDRDITLLLIGDGSKAQIKAIKSKISLMNLEKKVKLKKFINDPYLYLKNAHICLSASRDFEPFGLTLVEAMALRVPLVISDVGGMPEVIGDSEAGKICNRNDAKKYSDEILLYLSSKRKRELAGSKGRERYLKSFTAKKMANNYKQLFIGNLHEQ